MTVVRLPVGARLRLLPRMNLADAHCAGIEGLAMTSTPSSAPSAHTDSEDVCSRTQANPALFDAMAPRQAA